MDLTKIMRPNKNNVILAVVLLFLTTLPTYEIEVSGIFSLLQIFVQTENFGNGLPLPYIFSSSRTVFFLIPGGTVVNVNYVNLFADLIFWFLVSSLIVWKYFRGRK